MSIQFYRLHNTRPSHNGKPTRQADTWIIESNEYWRSPTSGHWLCIDSMTSAPTLRELFHNVMKAQRIEWAYHYNFDNGCRYLLSNTEE